MRSPGLLVIAWAYLLCGCEPTNSGPPSTTDAGRSTPDAPPVEVFTFAPPELLAKRLALLLWNEEADQALIDRLRAAPIDGDQLSRIAGEMMTDTRAREGMHAFFRWWLQVEGQTGISKTDPEGVLDDQLSQAMIAEGPALGVHLMLDTRGTFADLLTASYTFVNERLARHYDMTGVTGDHFRAVPYPPGQHRSGLLTGAGLLTMFASLSNPSWPAKRSWLITDPVLCVLPIRSLLPPPPLDPNRSIRQQMIDITKSGGCMGCHNILNSPGFAYIGFDTFGRWRPEPGHGPGETEGWIPNQIMPDEPRFDGPEDLARLLASRDEAPRCFTVYWLLYAVDRQALPTGDHLDGMKPSIDSAFYNFARSGFELRQLPQAIVRTARFAGAP